MELLITQLVVCFALSFNIMNDEMSPTCKIQLEKRKII